MKKDVSQINVRAIMDGLDRFEHNHNMQLIRDLFLIDAKKEKVDAANAQADYSDVWGDTLMPSAPRISRSSPSLGKARAAFKLEKGRCFDTVGSFAAKLLKVRNVPSVPAGIYLSDGLLAGATVKTVAPALGAESARDMLASQSPVLLKQAVERMKKTFEAKGFVQCGVLSGAAHEKAKFPTPEHYILAFAHDVIDGQDAILFWDPDAAATNIKSVSPPTAAPWGPGFGVLFFNGTRLSTAFNDADLADVERNKHPFDQFGNHLAEQRRHCYQVYTLQTLPMKAKVKLHAKLLQPPAGASYDSMLQNAVSLFAAHGIELIETSREVLAPDDDANAGHLRTVFIGDGGTREPSADLDALHDAMRLRGQQFGVAPGPGEIVVTVVDKLVPASRACSNHRPGQPAIVLSAALANEWTLAHEIGRVLGLGLAADPSQLMFVSTSVFGEERPSLDDDEVAAILASDLAQG